MCSFLWLSNIPTLPQYKLQEEKKGDEEMLHILGTFQNNLNLCRWALTTYKAFGAVVKKKKTQKHPHLKYPRVGQRKRIQNKAGDQEANKKR